MDEAVANDTPSDGDEQIVDATAPILEETYPLQPPFAYALVQTDPLTKKTSYLVVELPLDSDEESIYHQIREILIEELDVDFNVLSDRGEAENYLTKEINRVIKNYKFKLDEEQRSKIMYYVGRDLIGYGKIEPMLRDPMIEDVSCDGIDVPLYIWHRKYESIETNIRYPDEEELDSFIIKLAQRSGRHISIANPLLDAALPDGSRIQLTLGKEVTQKGSTFTIRKFRADPLTVTDIMSYNTIDTSIAAFYWFLMEHDVSILIAGGTAAGKTSLLNTLSMMIRPALKIVSIEDTPELNIAHQNWIPSVSRSGFGDGRGEISMYDLLRTAMRQRPDYIIVGEIRGSEAYTMFQAMSTGHRGMGTIHGDSVEGVVHRLENEPMNIPRSMMKSLDLIHVQRKVRFEGKFARRSVNVTEVIGLDPMTNEILTNKLYQWDAKDDTYAFFGRSYLLERVMENTGMTEEECWNDVERRKTILRWMIKKDIRYYKDVAKVITEFYSNPDATYERAKKEMQ